MSDLDVAMNALLDWEAMLASLGMQRNADAIGILWHVRNLGKSHRRNFLLVLKGTGHCSDEFIVDSSIGEQAAISLKRLFKAAGEPQFDEE